MAGFDVMMIAGVVVAFSVFGAALAYVNAVAGARAITAEEEAALRIKK